MKSNNLYLLLCTSFIFLLFFSAKVEDDYYIFPVNPGSRNYLSGNFCELRSTHMHAGIDIKVGGVTGAPIHAAAEGYVSRIKISWGGYGNALYLQHPNGTTTVYAHLDEFSGKIGEYVRKAQYNNKTFDIELFPGKSDLTVKRGEVIAKAGNSGSSGGPHLHFEIRDANQVPLDPLQYNFEEVVDKVAPYVRKVALVTLDKDARINGQFGRFEFPVSSNGSSYQVNEVIETKGLIGVEVAAFDKANGVRNVYGVTASQMKLDGEPRFSYHTKRMPFSVSKNIFVHVNYEERYRQDRTFFRMYLADGNAMPIYNKSKSDGKLLINDDQPHQVDIELTDHYGNQSSLRIKLQGKPHTDKKELKLRYFGKPYTDQNYHVRDHVLQLFAPVEKSPEGIYQRKRAKFYTNRMGIEKDPAYVVNDIAVYLWDLNQGVPDSVDACGHTLDLPIKMRVPASNAFSYYQPEMDVHFSKNDLFDTLYLTTDYQYNNEMEVFRLHQEHTPLKGSIEVKLKPRSLPDGPLDKIHVYRLSNSGDLGYEGGEWQGKSISFYSRYFGDFVLAADTIDPVITPLKIGNSQLKFKIEDGLSGIKSYDAYINGEWVLMEYDYKWDVIWTSKSDKRVPLQGDYKIVVTDNAGNTNTLEGSI